MSFLHPEALLLLLLTIPLVFFGFWGWRRQRELAALFSASPQKVARKQIEKYLILVSLVSLIVVAIASPRMAVSQSFFSGKTGEVIFLADVSFSAAARKNLDSPSRIERTRALITELLERFPFIRSSVCGFTSMARCFSLLTNDHVYLKRSVERVLDINSVPGSGTDIPASIMQVVPKFSAQEEVKVIVVFSDGEIFQAGRFDERLLRQALEKTAQELQKNNIVLFVVGVGEPEGAQIPIYDLDGRFTGYAEYQGRPYVTRLEEKFLREVAAAANGSYFSENDREGLANAVADVLRNEQKSEEQKSDLTYFLMIPITVLSLLFLRRHVKI